VTVQVTCDVTVHVTCDVTVQDKLDIVTWHPGTTGFDILTTVTGCDMQRFMA
jgi:hypothetical protein